MSIQFDGVNDLIRHGTPIGNEVACTAMGWIYYLTASLDDSFWGKIGTGVPVGIGLDNRTAVDRMTVDFGGSNFGSAGIGTLVTGVWQHWAVVFDGAGVGNAQRLKVYRDGVAEPIGFSGTIPATTQIGDGVASDPWTLGTRDGSANFANMRVAHHKVWRGALSEGAVQAEMLTRRPHRTEDLVVLAPYDEQPPDPLALDYSGRGFHGVVTGAVWSPEQPAVVFG